MQTQRGSKWTLETSEDDVVPIGSVWIPVLMFTYNNKYLVTWENNTLKVNTNETLSELKGLDSKSIISTSTIWIKEEGTDTSKTIKHHLQERIRNTTIIII